MKEKLESLVGRKAFYSVGPLVFRVVIRDVRSAFGRTDCLIEPECGTGQKWIAEDSLRLEQ